MLELAILGLLQDKASYGYELKQELDRKLGHFWQVSMGSLYPTLNRLEERGAIEVLAHSDKTARRKKVYRITDVGREEFVELIDDPTSSQWDDEKFPLRFAFFHYVKPEVRLRLLERRRAYLVDKLEDFDESLREAGERIDSYTLSLMRHGMEQTAADIEWLDELIAAERRQASGIATEDAADPGATAGAETSATERATARTNT